MGSSQAVRSIKVALTLIVLAIAWEFACRALNVPPYLVPTPSAIGMRLVEKSSLFWIHSPATLFIISVAGIILYALDRAKVERTLDLIRITSRARAP